MIEFKDVSFSYISETEEVLTKEKDHKDYKNSISDLNLSISKGDFVLITGLSGCGKTTILRLLSGLIPNYYPGVIKGEITINNQNISTQPIYETSRYVKTVFQNPKSQFFNIDTTSELAFGCENLGVDKDVILERINSTAAIFNIEDLLDRNIFKLSGGEKQKIACATIDIESPEVILLDEPSANLDYESTLQLRNLILIWKNQGKTIIAAEHRISYLWDLLDRAIILESGKIKKDLSKDELNSIDHSTIKALGLRSTNFESPSQVSLPSNLMKKESFWIKDFSFTYKKGLFGKDNEKRKIFDISSMKISKNCITAITGSNGCGKTTFLNGLCGISKGAKGSVLVNDKPLSPKERQRSFFMVMQDVNHQLFTESVLEEVMISFPEGAEHNKKEKAEQILNSLGLYSHKNHHPMALSGGQKQRLCVGCALASGCEYLIFDEPTSGLDYKHMIQVANLLKKLKDMGNTIIVVTHDSEFIKEIADCKITLEEGLGL